MEIADIESVICVMEPAELRKNLKKKLADITDLDIRKVVDDYIHVERDRQILKRRYCDGIHLEPLAEEFELTPKQVRNIIVKYEAVLFKHLK